jgi:alkylation response protein AidB-like acyl-CoA dehydrogenase
MFIVPMDTPGVKVVPMRLMGEHDINQTFYEDVRVPAANLVGGENNGWTLITNQLNHERVTLCSPGIIERTLGETKSWAATTTLANGQRVIDQQWVQVSLARVHARLEFLKLMNWKVAWSATQNRLDVADASSVKVFGTEFYLEAFRLLFEIVGQRGYLKPGSADEVLKARLEGLYRSLLILTFGGGTNEIQRDLIAVFGLGLPRALR